MKISIGPNSSKACIVLESREDIERMNEIVSRGINCMSDRGKDVEHVADVLRAAAQIKAAA